MLVIAKCQTELCNEWQWALHSKSQFNDVDAFPTVAH